LSTRGNCYYLLTSSPIAQCCGSLR
jgi:hypothetical protein